MKKANLFGKRLTKGEQRMIRGGYEDYASCKASCNCSSTCMVVGTCNVNPCSASDGVGVQCGSTWWSCAQMCAQACHNEA